MCLKVRLVSICSCYNSFSKSLEAACLSNTLPFCFLKNAILCLSLEAPYRLLATNTPRSECKLFSQLFGVCNFLNEFFYMYVLNWHDYLDMLQHCLLPDTKSAVKSVESVNKNLQIRNDDRIFPCVTGVTIQMRETPVVTLFAILFFPILCTCVYICMYKYICI